VPAVDIADTDKAYEITAELPGIDEKNVEVKFASGVLTIKGEKNEEKDKPGNESDSGGRALSGNEHRRPLQAALAQVGKRSVGLRQLLEVLRRQRLAGDERHRHRHYPSIN
jgi:HSP20 family molecular chaperone IbpA